MLEIQNLMVFYENALALNDFSMRVEEGTIVAVIGSNSAACLSALIVFHSQPTTSPYCEVLMSARVTHPTINARHSNSKNSNAV